MKTKSSHPEMHTTTLFFRQYSFSLRLYTLVSVLERLKLPPSTPALALELGRTAEMTKPRLQTSGISEKAMDAYKRRFGQPRPSWTARRNAYPS